MNLDDCELPEVREYLEAPRRYGIYVHTILADAALAALWERVQFAESWPGLLAFLNRVFPESVFDGSSGDQGPRIVVLTRALGRAVAERDKAEAECDRLRTTYLALRQQREADAAVAASVAVAGRPRSGRRPS